MSLVSTAISNSSARFWHKVPTMVLLPVPTGPTTPSRSDRCGVVVGLVCGREATVWSGNEYPPRAVGMGAGVVFHQWCTERGQIGRVGHGGGPDYGGVDIVGNLTHPVDGIDRIDREQLERCGGDGLRIAVQAQSCGLLL